MSARLQSCAPRPSFPPPFCPAAPERMHPHRKRLHTEHTAVQLSIVVLCWPQSCDASLATSRGLNPPHSNSMRRTPVRRGSCCRHILLWPTADSRVAGSRARARLVASRASNAATVRFPAAAGGRCSRRRQPARAAAGAGTCAPPSGRASPGRPARCPLWRCPVTGTCALTAETLTSRATMHVTVHQARSRGISSPWDELLKRQTVVYKQQLGAQTAGQTDRQAATCAQASPQGALSSASLVRTVTNA